MELDVTDAVEAFRQVVAGAWPYVSRMSREDRTESFLDDWLQANWERLVEGSVAPELKVVLEPYGGGADCNIGSSRVWRPDLLPTTAVYIRNIANETLLDRVGGAEVEAPMQLSHFCTVVEGWPANDLPFDHVALESGEVFELKADRLRYFVQIGRR